MRLNFAYLFLICQFNATCLTGQNSRDNVFKSSFDSIANIVSRNADNGFKQSVFFVENAFASDSLSIESFNNEIDILSNVINLKAKKLGYIYEQKDSIQHWLNNALFLVMTNVTILKIKNDTLKLFPFKFNHADPLGKNVWFNNFVSTLLITHKGNCKSLSYLYKILADELGAKCWISLAPRHLYIKNYSIKTGWYNTELTSGTFPNNGWLMASGFVTLEAIKSGLYMDTLSNQQAIANLAIDLALGYQRKTGIHADSFILKCCDLTLQYHPVNPNALVLKAETMKAMYLKMTDPGAPAAKNWFTDIEKLYFQLFKLGYRQMPEKMYKEWLKELKINHRKYQNEEHSN